MLANRRSRRGAGRAGGTGIMMVIKQESAIISYPRNWLQQA